MVYFFPSILTDDYDLQCQLLYCDSTDGIDLKDGGAGGGGDGQCHHCQRSFYFSFSVPITFLDFTASSFSFSLMRFLLFT